MKLYKYLGFAALASLTLTSCSDFLDPDNKSTNNDDADAYLSAHPEKMQPVAYDAFKYFATHIDLHEEATDLYFVTAADDGLGDFLITPENGTVADYYEKSYKAINYANAMIHYSGADSELGNEGLFLRSFGYYYLIQQFGSVPYVTEYIQNSSRDYPRTPLDKIYEGLIKDLTDVYNAGLLPKTNREGKASLQAVAALLAKVELSAGWDLDVKADNYVAGTYTVNSREHFANAAAWAEKAIGGQALTMTFADKWSPFNEGNAEEIFSMQWERAGYPGDVTTGGSSMMNQYMSYYGNCNIIGQKGTPSGGKHRQSYKAMRLWGPGDERYNGTFMTEYWNAPVDKDSKDKYTLWGTEGYLAFYNCKPKELEDKNLAFKFYPAYYTEAEVRQDLATNYANNTHSFTEGYGIQNGTARAVILDYPAVTKIPFNLDGTLGAATQQTTADFITPAYGGVCVRKYDDPAADNVTRNQTYRDIPMLHLSEMYLVAAEAYYMSGNEAEALTKVNAVRTRAKADIQQSFDAYKNDVTYLPLVNSGVTFNLTTLDLILDEKARECYAERTRYEDLRRTKQLIRYNLAFSRTIKNPDQMKGPDGEYKLLRPIPQSEMDFNTAITSADQNPGY